MTEQVTFVGGKQFMTTDNNTHGTNPQYPSDGIGGVTATATASFLEGVVSTTIYEIIQLDASGSTEALTFEYYDGSSWNTFYQQQNAAATGPGNFVSFGDEGITVPGEVRFTAVSGTQRDFLISFKGQRGQ